MVPQNNTLTIRVLAYENWQHKAEEGKIYLSKSFFDDNAIVSLMAECPDSVFCFLWLIINADSEGVLVIDQASIKRLMMRLLCIQSSRFDYEKRLMALISYELITVDEEVL